MALSADAYLAQVHAAALAGCPPVDNSVMFSAYVHTVTALAQRGESARRAGDLLNAFGMLTRAVAVATKLQSHAGASLLQNSADARRCLSLASRCMTTLETDVKPALVKAHEESEVARLVAATAGSAGGGSTGGLPSAPAASEHALGLFPTVAAAIEAQRSAFAAAGAKTTGASSAAAPYPSLGGVGSAAAGAARGGGAGPAAAADRWGPVSAASSAGSGMGSLAGSSPGATAAGSAPLSAFLSPAGAAGGVTAGAATASFAAGASAYGPLRRMLGSLQVDKSAQVGAGRHPSPFPTPSPSALVGAPALAPPGTLFPGAGSGSPAASPYLSVSRAGSGGSGAYPALGAPVGSGSAFAVPPAVAPAAWGGAFGASTGAPAAPGTGSGGSSGSGASPSPAASRVPSLASGPAPLRLLVLPDSIVDAFLALSAGNTAAPPRGIETCGVLVGRLLAGAEADALMGRAGRVPGAAPHPSPRAPLQAGEVLLVSHLVLPPQTGEADACEVTPEGEEALLSFCLDQGLLTLGWVHTHPSQDCFMSAMDTHTHANYQAMLPEAVALVIAPRAGAFSLFRLTDESTPPAVMARGGGGPLGSLAPVPPGAPPPPPNGLSLILTCPLRGFHPHDERVLLYEESGHVSFLPAEALAEDPRVVAAAGRKPSAALAPLQVVDLRASRTGSGAGAGAGAVPLSNAFAAGPARPHSHSHEHAGGPVYPSRPAPAAGAADRWGAAPGPPGAGTGSRYPSFR